MMDLQSIVTLNREAAERAAEEDCVPLILTAEDLEAARAGHIDGINIPEMGDYTPDGWTRVDLQEWFPGAEFVHGVDFNMEAFFVDHSGFGSPGEPALTVAEFFAMARPGFGYAVVECGQFQLYMGVFQKVRITE